MTAQFPGDFVIADRRKIEKINLEPRYQRRAQTMHGVEMPIDFGAIVEVTVAQESETVAANLIRFRHNRLRLMGQMFPQEANALREFIRRKRKISRRFGGVRNPFRPGCSPILHKVTSSRFETSWRARVSSSSQLMLDKRDQSLRPVRGTTTSLSSSSRYTPI